MKDLKVESLWLVHMIEKRKPMEGFKERSNMIKMTSNRNYFENAYVRGKIAIVKVKRKCCNELEIK